MSDTFERLCRAVVFISKEFGAEAGDRAALAALSTVVTFILDSAETRFEERERASFCEGEKLTKIIQGDHFDAKRC